MGYLEASCKGGPMGDHDAAEPARTPSGDVDDLIGRVYDVALDPLSYEQLVDRWNDLVMPGAEAGPARAPMMDDPAIFGHFERAGAVLDRVASAPTGDAVALLLDHLDSVAALVIDRHLRVAGLNPAAAHALGLRADAALSEATIDAQDRAALSRKVARMLEDTGSAPSVFRVRAADAGRFIVFHMRRRMVAGAPMVVAVTAHLHWPDGFDRMLSEAFGLSTAETEVVRLLIDCASVREIAEKRGRSVETIRAQVKAIMAKTETRGQVELVRLVLSMMDIAGVAAGREADSGDDLTCEGQLRSVPFQRLVGPDGRRLEYLVLGDPAGRPAVYLHSAYGLTRWPAQAERALRARQIALIVPVRAGYGGSDSAPRSLPYSRQVVRDMLALLDHLGVERAPVISHEGDAQFAFWMAHGFPDRVSAIIPCGAFLPLTRPEQIARMNKWHRMILGGARYTPKLLPFMIKAGFHLARKGGRRAFLHAVLGEAAADVALLSDPDFLEAMVTGSHVALNDTHTAHDAMSRNVLEQARIDWTEAVHAARYHEIPVHMVNGAQDVQCPAATLQEFAQDYPWIDFHVHEDAGQLVLFAKWPEVLNLLEPYLEPR